MLQPECRAWRGRPGRLHWGRLLLLALALLCLLKLWADFWPGYVIDYTFADVLPGADPANWVAKQCSALTGVCYNVVDYPTDELGLEAHRVIYLTGLEQEVDTMVQLVAPAGRTFFDSDTRFWPVNHTRLASQYVALMCLAPLAVQSLPSLQAGPSQAALLVVGLGGGSVDMFFHTLRPEWRIDVFELDPVVKQLANDWFGVVEDERRRTRVQDGVKAIREAAERSAVYDLVSIDACDQDKQLPCPVKDFLSPAVLRDVKQILSSRGCLVVNFLAQEGQAGRLEAIQRRLLDLFPTCLQLRADRETNLVVVCLRQSVPADDLASRASLWLQRVTELAAHFHFDMRVQLSIKHN